MSIYTFFRYELITIMKCQTIFNNIRTFSTENIIPKVCIVGSGPAGFYAAQQLLKVKIGNRMLLKLDL